MNLIRENFRCETIEKVRNATYLVVAVKLPTGAIELITNTQKIESKCEYYLHAYDDDFRLLANKNIQVVEYMLV